METPVGIPPGPKLPLWQPSQEEGFINLYLITILTEVIAVGFYDGEG